MTSAFRSKDEEFMKRLKKSILLGMKGHMPEDKERTWQYVRKQVVLDDLHKYTIACTGKLIHFPEENHNAGIMAVFLQPPTEQEKLILDRAIGTFGLRREDVYTTYLRKTEVETEQEISIMETVLNSEISVVNPQIVMTFGVGLGLSMHEVHDFKQAKLIHTYDMRYVLKEEENGKSVEEKKKMLWNDIKQIMAHYKLN